MTAREMLLYVGERLKKAGIEEYQYESRAFLEWIFGINRSDYYMNPEVLLPEEKINELEEKLSAREKRVPLQYLMGTCEFMGYSFQVDERVLIPRQDTECLVEEAISLLSDCPKPKVLDLCCGSGCIGISIKKLRPDAEVTLSDLSGDALAVAGANAKNLGAEVRLLQGDLFEKISDSFDCIVSNPPYIPSETIEGLMPEVRDYEPRMALDGTGDGLFFYKRIAKEAPSRLKPGGWLLMEIGMEQGESLCHILKGGEFAPAKVKKDLVGLDRIVTARRL